MVDALESVSQPVGRNPNRLGELAGVESHARDLGPEELIGHRIDPRGKIVALEVEVVRAALHRPVEPGPKAGFVGDDPVGEARGEVDRLRPSTS